ncbi:MAG: UDP-N-acetylglucosamine 1-carboxyvinyltransferase [Candidatus Magasanikbacteria bacterium]
MARFSIQGGTTLKGILSIHGSKNAALPILACTLIEEGEYILHNIPDLKDVETMINLLHGFGLKTERVEEHSYKIINSGIADTKAPYELVKAMRASFVVMGPLLAHKKRASVPLPGGCAIGTRPVDVHLKGFEALGAHVNIEHGFVNVQAHELVGKEMNLDLVTVTGTENIVMAAVKAHGTTIIHNAAKEPEVEDLCNFLVSMGAKIEGIGTDTLSIQGVEKLTPGEYTIIPDRIETGTFIIASLITGCGIEIEKTNSRHLGGFISKLEQMGVKFDITQQSIKVSAELGKLKCVSIDTEPYPGFPTDLQAQTMVLLSLVKGISEIKENIFENRFGHVLELNRLGAHIKVEGNKAIIEGGVKLSGAEVLATDLRAGASLVLAGLVADNTTIVNDIHHIERGYEDLESRLTAVGAKIKRVA